MCFLPTGTLLCPFRFTIPARRTQHIRHFNDFKDPEPIPRGTDFSSVIEFFPCQS